MTNLYLDLRRSFHLINPLGPRFHAWLARMLPKYLDERTSKLMAGFHYSTMSARDRVVYDRLVQLWLHTYAPRCDLEPSVA